jgi:glutamyl-tRNA synthetase
LGKEEKISFTDLIRGEITFDGSLMGDIAIAKDSRTPLYNFAVVVDDFEMKISHVIRGEDHIGNTPKQLFLQKALKFNAPQYAHLPLILDEKRAKLSKRFAAVSVDDYQKDGFIPEAFVNFMALLGWHPGDDREVMPLEEIVKEFSIDRVQKAGAIFNIEKLRWMNGEYIKKIDNTELLSRIISFSPEMEIDLKKFNLEQQLKLVSLSKERMQTLMDFKQVVAFLVKIGEYPSELLVWKKSNQESAKNNLLLLREELLNLTDELFIKIELERIIKSLTDKFGKGDIFWPLRVALSGQEASPPPIEIMEILGKDESLERINKAIQLLQA